eukprot:CAMPEP_0114494564 /NCGR_PEP_ID=MMETSP0109-20121206/4722_1 /TAXON_ID=29199 /ORGANISM="Chlorarachnion reptans, Strain CCCM449" /LENGTH=391 /DNA_ID=CAMNT_0001671615 /DNA_START=13 /DNA_END=1185 /DNA_ORIENTATION=+
MSPWLISDSIKLTLLGLQIAFNVLELLSPGSKGVKQHLQILSGMWLLLLFTHILGLHEPLYFGWKPAFVIELALEISYSLVANNAAFIIVKAKVQACKISRSTPSFLIYTHNITGITIVMCCCGLGFSAISISDSILSLRLTGGRTIFVIVFYLLLVIFVECSLIHLYWEVVKSLEIFNGMHPVAHSHRRGRAANGDTNTGSKRKHSISNKVAKIEIKVHTKNAGDSDQKNKEINSLRSVGILNVGHTKSEETGTAAVATTSNSPSNRPQTTIGNILKSDPIEDIENNTANQSHASLGSHPELQSRRLANLKRQNKESERLRDTIQKLKILIIVLPVVATVGICGLLLILQSQLTNDESIRKYLDRFSTEYDIILDIDQYVQIFEVLILQY